jgi:7-carboxy-7-deazaguanine synthase
MGRVPAVTLMISEIFGPTIQGEGPLIGRPSVFVRTGGCDYRCSWCDTLFAVLPEYKHEWTRMNAGEVLDRVRCLSSDKPLLITLTGGNPALQDMQPLINDGHAHGYSFAIETQGSVAQPWFDELDFLVLSPKPPSAGRTTSTEDVAKCLEAAGTAVESALKVVVFDDSDFQYATELHERFPKVRFHLQVGNHTPPPAEVDPEGLMDRFRWLSEKLVEARLFDAVLLPQLHTLVWGNQRGV